MTTGVRTAPEAQSVWDTHRDSAAPALVIAELGHADGRRPAPVVYPKRSELRRAEARAGRDGARRTDRGIPAGRLGGVGDYPGQHVAAPRGRVTESRTLPPRPTPSPSWRSAEPTDDTTPSGLRVPAATPSAFVTPAPRPPLAPSIPGPGPGSGPRADETSPITRVVDTRTATGPVTAMPDPAAWTADEDASPRRSGRRRAGEERQPAGRSRRPQVLTAVTTPGRGTASAARLLALALVVGFEGLAVTSLVRTARTAPLPEDGDSVAAGAVSSAATLAGSADSERFAVVAQGDAVTAAAAQTQSGSAKMASAIKEAQAAADRAKALAERRARAMRNAQRDPRAVARVLVADRGWGSSQFTCLDKLWTRESQWNYRAQNPSSGAYGIPQALPATKLASAGSDWRTNPVTQIEWGLDYIEDRYGTPCGAWGHSESVGWY